MFGKPIVCIALSAPEAADRQALAPLHSACGPLFMPFLGRSGFYYLLRQCRQAGLDTLVILLDDWLAERLDALKLLVAGLPLEIEWLCPRRDPRWRERLLERLEGDEPLLLWQNPGLELLPLQELLAFHAQQQADCTLRLSPVADARSPRVGLDAQGQLHVAATATGGYDTRCYLLEPDIFEELLEAEVDLLSHSLLGPLQKFATYLSGLLDDRPCWRWQGPEAYFAAQQQALEARLLEPACQRRLRLEAADVWLGEGVRVPDSVRFTGPVVIGDRTMLAAGVEIQGPAVIEADCRLDADCRVSQSWIWPGCELGRESRVEQSWLGERVSVAAKSRLQALWAGDRSRLSLPQPLPGGSRLGADTLLKLPAQEI